MIGKDIIDQLHNGVIQSYFYHPDSATRNKDIQRKHIGRKKKE